MNLSPRWILMLTLPPLLWAGNAVVGRLLVGIVPPLALNAMRWTLAFAILLPMGWKVFKDLSAIRQRWKYLSVLGLLGMGSYNALLYGALQTSTPLNVTLIAASTPIFMLFIGTTLYGVKTRGVEWLGAALSVVGVATVLSRGDWDTLLRIRLVPGDVLMLVAVVAWAAYTWLLARPPQEMRGTQRPPWNWADFLLVQTTIGCAWAWLGAGVEYQLTAQPIIWSPKVVAAFVYVAIGPSVLAYWCWGRGVAAVGPATAAFFANLTPVFAALLSTSLLGETPEGYHLVAFVLIALGIVVSSRQAKSQRQKVPG